MAKRTRRDLIGTFVAGITGTSLLAQQHDPLLNRIAATVTIGVYPDKLSPELKKKIDAWTPPKGLLGAGIFTPGGGLDIDYHVVLVVFNNPRAIVAYKNIEGTGFRIGMPDKSQRAGVYGATGKAADALYGRAEKEIKRLQDVSRTM